MTGREKIEAAFLPEGTPEFGVAIPYEGIYIRDRWADLTARPWWDRHDPRTEVQVAWRADVRRCLAHDWIPLSTGPSREDRENVRIEHRAGGVFRVDARTGKEVPLETPTVGGWNSEGGLESAQSALKEETTEEVDRLVCEVPRFDAGSVDWGGRDDLPRAMLAGFGQDLYPIAHITSPLWGCYPIWGFEGLMAAIADKPDLVRFAGERLLARSINAALRAAALGAKAVWIEECITDQISPASFESINVPVLRRLVGEARAAGLKTIYYYCGDPAGKLDLIRSIGADALSFEESKKGFRVDIEEMADMIRGECVLLGNLDAVGILENGTERELRAEIERQMSAGRRNGGRFIMSLGSPVTPDTPPERVRLYCDIAHEVGASSPA